MLASQTDAELSGRVAPPRPESAVVLRRERVEAAGRELDDPGQAADLNGHAAESGGAVTELTVAVAPPGPQRAVIAQRHREEPTGADGLDA